MASVLRGEIRWAEPDPARGNEQQGTRPVLVVSHDVFNERSGTVLAMTNTTLRERFGIDTKNSATASRLIKEAMVAGVIRLQNPNAPPKTRRHLPHWA